ncbi:biotin--[acetyl-CoA-carboxylase] ligase [soil metagenome]
MIPGTRAGRTPGVFADLERVAELLRERGGELGREVRLFAEIDSTNDEAKRCAKSGAAHGTVFVAESQTRGRGRQGRSWVSPRGENLLFSVLLRLTCAPARLPPLALVCGLAVRDAILRAAPKSGALVKWPNDVLIDRKKVSGVLVEATLSGTRVDAVIVGIGINVHTRELPDELGARATSVALHAEAPADRASILADVIAGLDRDLSHVAARGLGLVHARLSAADALIGSRVTLEECAGIARGIDLEGRLLLDRDDGTRVRISSGEVTLA